MSDIIFQQVTTCNYIFRSGIFRKCLVNSISVKGTAQMLNTICFFTKVHATSQRQEHLCTLGKTVTFQIIHNILCLFYGHSPFILFNGLRFLFYFILIHTNFQTSELAPSLFPVLSKSTDKMCYNNYLFITLLWLLITPSNLFFLFKL